MIGHNDNFSSDRRFGQRNRAFKKIKIIAGKNEAVFDGILRNVSQTGANIEISCAGQLPPRFQLQLGGENIRRNCKIVWRKPENLGVVFL